MAIRNGLYDWGLLRRHRALCPVISVGNLTVGGTGKTPLVEYLCRQLRAHDVRVTVISRGYGAVAGRNDEALVLEENLPDVPHLQGPDRVELARVAVEELETDVIVLDDGYQHRRLHRDLDVVVVDSTCPWGHGWVLPRGLLREARSGLRRADLVVLTRCDQVSSDELAGLKHQIQRLAPGRPVVESRHAASALIAADGQERPVEILRGVTVGGFCGIGRPEGFFRLLRDLGARLVATRIFADHHPYSRADVADLEKWAARLPEQAWIVTTQKDMVKLRLPALAGRPVWALRIQLSLTANEGELHRYLIPFLPEHEDAHGRQPTLSAV
jgi:tetraacyldisaccharide 4'-kinase